MLNFYDQLRIEAAQRSTMRSLEGIRDCLREMNQMVTPLTASATLKSQNHGVSCAPPGSIPGSASASNRASR